MTVCALFLVIVPISNGEDIDKRLADASIILRSGLQSLGVIIGTLLGPRLNIAPNRVGVRCTGVNGAWKISTFETAPDLARIYKG